MLANVRLLLLATVSLAGIQSQPHASNFPKAPPTEVPTVSLCDLLSKPADYNDKEIRVRAQYSLGFEWSFFSDDSCKEFAVETTPRRTADVVWAEFGEPTKSLAKPELSQRLGRALALCCPTGWRTSRTEMVVVGKFFKADGVGFGNQGRYEFQLVVSKVEEVGDTKLVDP